MINSIILNILLGGATGYLTDELVINLLYKDYSPIKKYKIGGTIPFLRKDFIKRLSKIMERDIISGKKISNALVTGDYQEEFRAFTKDLFEECLCRDTRNLRLKDIDLFGEIVDSIYNVLTNLLEKNIDGISSNILKSIAISEVLSSEQIAFLSNKVVDYLSSTVKNTNFLKETLEQTYDGFCHVKVGDLISKDVMSAIRTSLEKKSINFGKIIKDGYDEELDNYLNKIIDNCNIDEEIKEIQEKIGNTEIRKFFRVSEDNVKKSIINNIIIFVEGEIGKKAIYNIYNQLKDYFISEGYSLFNLYSKNYRTFIREYMKDKGNTVVQSIMQWADSNEQELGEIVSNTIGEVISGNEQLKDKIYKVIIDYYKRKKYDDDSIAKRLEQYALEGPEIDEIADFIIAGVDGGLKSIKAKNVIARAEENGIIGQEQLYDSVVKYLKYEDNKELDEILDNIFDKPVNAFFNVDFVKIYKNRFKYVVIDYLKEKFFYSQTVYKLLVDNICNILENKTNETVGEVFKQTYLDKYSKKISDWLSEDMLNNKEKVATLIASIVESSISGKSLDYLFDLLSETNDSFRVKVNNRVLSHINLIFKEYINEVGDIRISKMLSNISSMPNVYESLEEFIKVIAGESIHAISDGQVRQFVEDVFNALTEEQFNEFINSILYFNKAKVCGEGFALGGVIGIANTVIANNYTWQGISVKSVAICSAVGMITNVVAQNRFFNISVPKNIIKKLPMFRDRIEENLKRKQERFALYMGDIVREKLIDDKSLEMLTNEKEPELKKKILGVISENNYQKIYGIVEENSEYISGRLSNYEIGMIQENKNPIVDFSCKEIEHIQLKEFINRNIVDRVMDKSTEKHEEIYDIIFKYLMDKLHSQIPLSIVLNEDDLNKISDISFNALNDGYEDIIKNSKNMLDILKHLRKYNTVYNDILDKQIVDIISRESLEYAQNEVFNFGYEKFFNEKRIERTAKRGFRLINNTYPTNKKIGDVINRKDLFLINSMFYKYFKDIVASYHNHLLSVEADVVQEIKQKILSNMNLREKSSYVAIGGEQAIDRIVYLLLNHRVPEFFEKNYEQFYDISKNITNELYGFKLEDIGCKLDYNYIEDIVLEIFGKENQLSVINNKCYLVFRDYMKNIEIKSIRDIAVFFNFNNIDSIYNSYKNEISFMIDAFNQKLITNKNNVISTVKGFAKNARSSIFLELKMNDIFKDIKLEDIEKLNNKSRMIVEEADLLSLGIGSLSTNLYNYLDEFDLLGGILDLDILRSNIKKSVIGLLKKPDFREYLNSLNADITTNQIKEVIVLEVPSEVLNYLFETIVEGFYLAMYKNLNSLYKTIQLDQITINEIMNLSSEKYKKLFENMYNHHLPISYGIGISSGLLGINKYVGIGLALWYGVSGGVIRIINKFIKKKKTKIDDDV